MKSATSVIALVAAIAPFALAVPFNFERDDVKYEYVTTATTVQAWVTVTPGAENVKAAEVATSSTSSHDHTHKEGGWTHSHAASSTAAPAPPATSPSAFSAPPLPTSEAPVPTTAPASTTEAAKAAAAPAPSSSSSSSSSSTTSQAAPAVSAASVPDTNVDLHAAFPSSPPENSTGPDMTQQWLQLHNNYRAAFGAAPLVWDKDLEQIGHDFWNQEATWCTYGHNEGNNPYGQNIGAGMPFSPMESVNMWMDEYKTYNFYSSGGDHFTQVVWKGATKVGCAAKFCKGWWNTRCNYDTGNDMSAGELEKNVGKPTGTVPNYE